MFKMAFRNLSRNKKRTGLTVSAIIIGITFVTFLLAWLSGVEKLVTESGKRLSGDIRFTSLDFELKQMSLDNSSNISYSETKNLITNSGIKGNALGRIKFGSLMFVGDSDEKALGYGIEEKDYDIIGFDTFMSGGRFLDFSKSKEIIVGDRLREKLNLHLGDEVTVLTSTQYKSTYALNYKVVGFFKMDNQNFNRSFYISLKDAMYHLDMDDRVTEYLLFLDKSESLNKSLETFSDNKNILIKGWKSIGLNALISGALPIIKLVFIIAFSLLAGVGITNTMMMIVYERRKEIGVLKAQGFRDNKILKLFTLEGTLMGIVGSVLGVSLGGFLAYYFSINGINLGLDVESLGVDLNVKSIIYTQFSLVGLIIPMVCGILVSTLTTIYAVLPELKLEAVSNLRSD